MSNARHPYIAAAASVEVVSDGEPKKRIQLLPLGKIVLRDGRGPFTMSKEDAHAVVATTRNRAGKTDMMVDYDHQSFYGAVEGVGGQAPAAGWIDPATLAVEDDGIWGTVEWTAAADAKIRAKEYRYLSPLFSHHPTTLAVTAIQNAGLTNTPAIDDLVAVASADLSVGQPENPMPLELIAAAAGLAPTATEAEIVTKVTALAGTAAALVAAGQKLGLQADASADEVVVAASAKPDPAKFAPTTEVASLKGEVEQLKTDALNTKVAASVAGALTARKISPSLESWATKTATKDFAGWEDFLSGAPVLVAAGEQFAHMQDPPKPEHHGLTADELKVAASMNLTAEEYAAAKAQEA
jgi:phage I-like protein